MRLIECENEIDLGGKKPEEIKSKRRGGGRREINVGTNDIVIQLRTTTRFTRTLALTYLLSYSETRREALGGKTSFYHWRIN